MRSVSSGEDWPTEPNLLRGGDAAFDYNGYGAAQLKAIGECIADIPGATCPSYSASGEDHYTGTIKHANMPTGVISTRAGWMQWADAAMKANDYDGIYGKVALSSANDPTHSVKNGKSTVFFRLDRPVRLAGFMGWGLGIIPSPDAPFPVIPLPFAMSAFACIGSHMDERGRTEPEWGGSVDAWTHAGVGIIWFGAIRARMVSLPV